RGHGDEDQEDVRPWPGLLEAPAELAPAARLGEREPVRRRDHQSADLIRRTMRKFTSEITAMSMNSAQPIADAYPSLNWLEPKDFSYRYMTTVWYCLAEPPVEPERSGSNRYGSVNSWRPPIVEMMTVKMIVGRRFGIVTCQSCRHGRAPSI